MLSLVAHLIRARMNGVILPDRPPDTSNDGMSSCRPTAAKLSAICTAGSNTQGAHNGFERVPILIGGEQVAAEKKVGALLAGAPVPDHPSLLFLYI